MAPGRWSQDPSNTPYIWLCQQTTIVPPEQSLWSVLEKVGVLSTLRMDRFLSAAAKYHSP
jgi:hypothetical protein